MVCPYPTLVIWSLESSFATGFCQGAGYWLVKKPSPANGSNPVPGVLGINIPRNHYRMLFGKHDPAVFDLPMITEAPNTVAQALQSCHPSNPFRHKFLSGSSYEAGILAEPLATQCRWLCLHDLHLILAPKCFLSPWTMDLQLDCWPPQHWFELRVVLHSSPS